MPHHRETHTPTSAAPGRLEVHHQPLAELKAAPRNPRTHTKRQIRQIAESIKAFGFNVPILVDGQNQVIAGHGRLKACELLGWNEVPTIRLDHLTEAQAKAYLVADNRLTECSTWDDRLLGETFQELVGLNLTFDLETTGFEMAEIDLLIEGLEAPPAEDPADEHIPCPPRPVSRLGDTWCLGPHRIHCGDALDPASYARLLQDQKASVVFTDPPYNVPIQGHVGGLGTVRHREFVMGSGEMTTEAFTAFLTSACTLMAQHSAEGSLHYVCMDWRHAQELLAAGRSAYTELKNLCVWVKDNAGMGSLYRSQHELVLVFKNGRSPHRNNVQLGRLGRYRTNVWRYAGVNSFGRDTAEGNLLALHPTVKPVALVADALKDASGRGDRVLDPFLGSGTTLMAAERTGRVCFGLELDPLYVDTALLRWERLTGQKAQLEETGQTYEALQLARTPKGADEGAHG